jgi:hypothetical protein
MSFADKPKTTSRAKNVVIGKKLDPIEGNLRKSAGVRIPGRIAHDVVASDRVSAGDKTLKRTPSNELVIGSNSQQTIQNIIDKAAQVLGSEDIAMRWLGTPVRALDFATPISLVGSEKGLNRIKNVLGQMESGVW